VTFVCRRRGQFVPQRRAWRAATANGGFNTNFSSSHFWITDNCPYLKIRDSHDDVFEGLEGGQKGVSTMEKIRELLGEPSARKAPQLLEWARNSKLMSVGWTAMRVWLGIMWIQAGVAKLWGAENPAFLHNNGAGVAGFASHGVAAYSWWGSFLHSFVVPNASWIALLVAFAEFAIGVALSIGLFTRVAALGSLALLFTYVMSGTASVCAFYALFALVVLATWRTSSWIGVDGLISGYRQRHASKLTSKEPANGDDVSTHIDRSPSDIRGLSDLVGMEMNGKRNPSELQRVN
jgi:thiosulfate dehydrogenase [quinone] large subunit